MNFKNIKVRVFTLTIDGDERAVETTVHPTEDAARAYLIGEFKYLSLRRGEDERKLSALSTDELCMLWEEKADGYCSLTEHELEMSRLEIKVTSLPLNIQS